MMRLIIFLLMGLFTCITAAKEPPKVVCYLANWAVYRPDAGKFNISDTDPRLCTHLIYAFVTLDGEANVKSFDAWADLSTSEPGSGLGGYRRVNELRQRNPSLKTMLAIGGWNMGSTPFSRAASTPELRRKFASSAVSFVREHGFDGFDIDWEYPAQREDGKPADKDNFVLLLAELSRQFKSAGLLLSAAVAAAEASASKSYRIDRIVPYLDFINLMTYDLHGVWDGKTGVNAPLYAGHWEKGSERQLNVDASVRYWMSNGAPPEKLVVGVPFYGRGFTLPSHSSNQNGIGVPTNKASAAGPYMKAEGTLGFNEICEKQKTESWKTEFQKEQLVPYTHKGDQWIGYDNERSLKEKGKYVKKMGLGGIMVWTIDTDDFRGNCGKKYPLLTAINEALGRTAVKTVGGHEPNNHQHVPPVAQTDKPVNSVGGSSSNSHNLNGPGSKGGQNPQELPKVPDPRPDKYPKRPQNSSSNSEQYCSREGLNRDPFECNAYRHCELVDGKFKAHDKQLCASELLFNPKISNCDWPINVQC